MSSADIQFEQITASEFVLVKNESASIVLNPTPSNDPNDPLNWSIWRKILSFTLVFAVSVAVFTALTIQTNFWQQMSVDMQISFEHLNNAQSANLAGLAVGCIFFIPFTGKYGRRSAYVLSTAVMAGVSWWSYKLNSLAELYLTNLFYGLAGAINETLVQVTIADLFFVHQRGRANSFYLLSVMFGSFLAPMVAGVQATRQGWRSSYLTLAICMTVLFFVFLFGYEETKYIPILEGRVRDIVPDPNDDNKAKENNSKTVPKASVQAQDQTVSIPKNTYKERMRWTTTTSEPLWELFKFPFRVVVLPHILFTSLQYSVCIVCLLSQASITSIVLSQPPYNFSTESLGYFTLAPLIGNLLGSFYAGIFGDWVISWLAKKNDGWFRPEFRLYPLLLPVCAEAAGLMAFGATLQRGMHWIYPAVGSAIFAFGLGAIGDITFTVVIDTYRPAFVCVSFFRNAIGIAVPFFITPWMTQVGLTKMFATIGSIAFVVGILFVPMILWGKRMRDAAIPHYTKLLLHQQALCPE